MSEYLRNLRRGRGFKQPAKPAARPARPTIPDRPAPELPAQSLVKITNVVSESRDLLFTLNTSNVSSYVFFELGTSTAYELGKFDVFFPVKQLTSFPVSSLFGSLTPGTLYFYRVTAVPTNPDIPAGPPPTGQQVTVSDKEFDSVLGSMSLATLDAAIEYSGVPLEVDVNLASLTLTEPRQTLFLGDNLTIDVALAQGFLTTQDVLVPATVLPEAASLGLTPIAATIGNAPPVWTSDLSNQIFVTGIPRTIYEPIFSNGSPQDKVFDPDGDSMLFSFNQGDALPPGVTVTIEEISGTQLLVLDYDGTPNPSSVSSGHTVTADDSSQDSDWVARSTASGVMVANNFDTYADIGADGLASTYGVDGQSNHGDPANGLFEWDQVNKVSGGGSYKVILNAPGSTNAATFSWPLDGALARRFNYDAGWNEFYVQFAFMAPAETVQVFFDVNDTSAGPKICIIDHFRGTASSSEVVLMDHQQDGFPATYIGLGNPNSGTISTFVPGISDYRIQSAVDAGGPLNTTEDYWLRYGPMLYASGVDTFFNNKALRTNVPNSTCTINGQGILPGEWMTFTQRVKLRPTVDDNPQSIYQLWGSKYGDPPKLLTSRSNFQFYLSSSSSINDPTSGPGFSGVNLTNFVTGLKSFGTGPGDTPLAYAYETWYDELITSREPINHPGGYTLPGIIAG